MIHKIILAVSVAISSANYAQMASNISKSDPAIAEKIKPVLAAREKSLIADGWVKIYENYKPEIVATENNFKQGTAYTALGAVYLQKVSPVTGMLIVRNDEDVFAGHTNVSPTNFILLEMNDFQPRPDLPKATFGVGLKEGDFLGTGLVIFEKKIDFKRDFYRLLEGRNNCFKDFRGADLGKNSDNFNSYTSTIGLGYFKSLITETAKQYKNIIDMELTDPETMTFLNNVIPVIQELPAKGYTVKEYEDTGGNSVTEFSKNGEAAMKMVSNAETLYFDFSKNK